MGKSHRKEKGAMNQTILPLIPAGTTTINEIVCVFKDEECWTYFLGAYPIYSHAANDLKMFRLTAAQLIDTGNVRECEIIKTFGVSKSSIDRALRKYREGGPEAFFNRRKGKREGTVMTQSVLKTAQKMLDEGSRRREITGELEIQYGTLVKAISDGRLHETENKAQKCTTKSDRSVKDAQAAEGMGTACTRPADRIMTAFGLLDGAQTHFEACRDVPYGGVLCVLPALLSNGLLYGIEKTLGKLSGYYHALHVLLLIAFMSLARIKTVESLRGKAPGEFGKLLGLDRIPEVRCLRKKLDELSKNEAAEQWAQELARKWMETEPDRAGVLYIDGHVRVYHGNKVKPPRKYVSRARLCLRGSTDYWVNDAIGRPFFVIDKVVDPGLLKVLREDIVPRLLKDVPNQPSQEELQTKPHLCRFILVFDREGYSPKFFKDMWLNHRIGCISYHKHPEQNWAEVSFTEQEVSMPNGETVEMKLAERGSLIGKKEDAIWVREVRKLTKNGHQTSLISTAYDLKHTLLAARMFTRWCQENFFGYMMEHFAIDLLSEYGTEELLDTTKVINPRWRELNRQKNRLLNKLRHRQARFAELTMHPASESDAKKFKKWIEKKSDLLEEIQDFEKKSTELKNQLKSIDKHIQWDQLDEQERFKKPAIGRKRLIDTVRMIAYRAETAMTTLITGKIIDTSAARKMLQDLFQAEADIIPDCDNKLLQIYIHRSSRPAVDKVLSILFDQLNQTETPYPGTDLRLVYQFVGNDQVPENLENGVTLK